MVAASVGPNAELAGAQGEACRGRVWSSPNPVVKVTERRNSCGWWWGTCRGGGVGYGGDGGVTGKERGSSS